MHDEEETLKMFIIKLSSSKIVSASVRKDGHDDRNSNMGEAGKKRSLVHNVYDISIPVIKKPETTAMAIRNREALLK